MTETRLDVLAIGDAVVDVIATASDAFLIEERLIKGSMQVLDAEGATRLYAKMRQARETSGGSAANTMAGVAALGGRAGFVGQVADDQLGEIFAHDIRALGVEFLTPAKTGGEPTGRCLILVTPDAQRTMNTFRGAAHELTAEALDRGADPGRGDPLSGGLSVALGRAARRRWSRRCGSRMKRGARSPSPCPTSPASSRTGRRSWRCSRPARSTCCSPTRPRSWSWPALAATEAAIAAIQDKVPLLVVTCGAEGALAVERGRRVARADRPDRQGRGRHDRAPATCSRPASWSGRRAGKDLAESLRIGAIAAAEVISHFGARPESDLKALIAA